MKVLKGLLVIGVMLGLAVGLGCGPTYPECDDDEHCADHNEFCVDSLCRECRQDGHCNASDSCKVCGAGYRCVKRPGCCHSDLDCPSGVCRMATGAGTGDCYGNCKSDAQCPAGQKCAGNMCVPGPECTGPGQCGADRECIDGRCIDMCKPGPVYFDYNEARIRMDAKPILEDVAKCVRKRAQSVTVEGHCDERGTDEYNLALGTKRAAAVRRYLSDLGISGSLMTTRSYGEEQPVCSGHSEDCWWRNRRGVVEYR